MTISHEPSAISPDQDRDGFLTWWTEADSRARHAFIAAALGWMLDSFDVMLYAMVGAALINDPTLHLSFQTNGLLGSITQLAAGPRSEPQRVPIREISFAFTADMNWVSVC